MKKLSKQSEGYNILVAREFYKSIHSDIKIYQGNDKLEKEYIENRETMYLSDNEKDIVTINDLMQWSELLIKHKKQQVINEKIKTPMIFRLYHDYVSGWIRFTLLSKDDEELEGFHSRSENFEFVSLKDVFEDFLNDREEGFFYYDENGERKYREYSFSDERTPTKIYEEEFSNHKLKVAK